MLAILRNRIGASLTESIGVGAVVVALGGLVAFQFMGKSDDAKESALQSQLKGFRDAVDMYLVDHGFYPCSPQDFNRNGDSNVLIQQLTEFTDATGKPSSKKGGAFCFGPYLDAFPAESVTGSKVVTIDVKNERTLRGIAQEIATSDAAGGWFYEARSGTVLPNLGKNFPEYLTAL